MSVRTKVWVSCGASAFVFSQSSIVYLHQFIILHAPRNGMSTIYPRRAASPLCTTCAS
ncbi:hypothetical protein BDR06DRAFT_964214 [Suillus hirtellus]|nr:hypothetical protein BDR06DRAFT_964214 [Suillus hirtellus]